MTAIHRSLAELPSGFGPSVAAIGNFDGVHVGHRDVLAAVVREARQSGMRAIAITFDPHPERFLRPDRGLRLLTTLERRLELLAATGIDAVVILPFDAELAGLTAEEFVRRVLVAALGVRSLHEGDNFRFGHQARAGIEELKHFGRLFGFNVHVHAPVRVHNRVHGLEVSSSAIRSLVAAGDVHRARWMLGRPFALRGTQARGRGIGTRLLVPTVNLVPTVDLAPTANLAPTVNLAQPSESLPVELLPAFGVYITRLIIAGRCFQSVTNVGNRPTFGAPSFAIESHILNFEPIEMDETTPIDLEFLLRLRGEIKFPSPEALKTQILKDVAKARRYFRLAK